MGVQFFLDTRGNRRFLRICGGPRPRFSHRPVAATTASICEFGLRPPPSYVQVTVPGLFIVRAKAEEEHRHYDRPARMSICGRLHSQSPCEKFKDIPRYAVDANEDLVTITRHMKLCWDTEWKSGKRISYGKTVKKNNPEQVPA